MFINFHFIHLFRFNPINSHFILIQINLFNNLFNLSINHSVEISIHFDFIKTKLYFSVI